MLHVFRRFRHRLAHGNRLGMFCLVIAVGLFVSGSVTIVHGLQAQRSVAATKNLGEIPSLNAQPKPGYFMDYADPVTIRIPSIKVESSLITVGKTAEGHIGSPQKPNFDKAAWYRYSPAPGQYGASVIVGHVDSYDSDNGASVFYSLAKLQPGDTVNVERSDKTTAIFKVYATREYKRQSLPANEVYNPHSANAELRLITCAGSFDEVTDEYESNTVIFAKLVDTHRAG
jgi:hypothetical protein